MPWQGYTDMEIYYIKDNMSATEICAEMCTRHADGWASILDRLYAMKGNDAPDYDAIAALL